MKTMKTYRIPIIGLMLLFMTGCMDVLDKRDLNVTGNMIWDDEVSAKMYLNKLYEDNMPKMALGSNSTYCDESFSSAESTTKLLYGLVDNTDFSTSYISTGTSVFHKDNYKLIRQINFCIDGMQGSSLNDSIKNVILGQALFLRAYRYWDMVKLYGGIPMVMRIQDPFTEDMNVPRSKTSESIELIIADLDKAIEGLPSDWLTDDKGRITSGAAAAFKGRVLLSWASPLFNPQNKADRWQRAYDANKLAIDILATTSPARALHPNFGTIFTTDVVNNTEAVLFRRYSATVSETYASNWENSIRPRSGGGSGGQNPTWNLVKSFPMANGKHILDASSGYDSTFYWQNRDPRFYHTIGYNGCTWEMAGKDQKIQWTYTLNIQENKVSVGTGFYNRKANDPTLARDKTSLGSMSWHELRYAEVLMNFAESANEIGKTDEAMNYVKMIRSRAGIEIGDGNYGLPANPSKEQLRELIMLERQVEFAFENQRYWDMRRRLMFREDLGPYSPKLNGNRRYGLTTAARPPWTATIGSKTSPYYGWRRIDTAAYLGYININDKVNYSTYFTTTRRDLETAIGTVTLPINYLPLYDFFAVPNAILNTTPSVKQTTGWFDGSYDPLAE
jgi:starch-binding outer membrane protein, SusD/RagB family